VVTFSSAAVVDCDPDWAKRSTAIVWPGCSGSPVPSGLVAGSRVSKRRYGVTGVNRPAGVLLRAVHGPP
jgi:hypothetical protein